MAPVNFTNRWSSAKRFLMQPENDPFPASLYPGEGWHCGHFFYQFNRDRLKQFSSTEKSEAFAEFIAVLNPDSHASPARLQTSAVVGHKADFSIMAMDADPFAVNGVHQRLLASRLGPALIPTYSFVSISEVSEYVPTLEQYGKRLVEEGETEGSPAYLAKIRAYEGREAIMRKARLTPDFPQWPVTCFYPMNKKREVGENWFALPFDERNRMMAEHGRSGMAFAGRVTQLITVSVGLDDWEWGVTLWAKTPLYLKEIVYKMRFDEASARYAEFGPFYTSYIMGADELLDRCFV